MEVLTNYQEILDKIERIDPKTYASTRNYRDGAVSMLSPYVSRGVISTKVIYQSLQKRGFHSKTALKFIQELAWRDYFQQVWRAKGDELFRDLKNEQQNVKHHGVPEAVLNASTGILAVDKAIEELYNTGYMHNHMRMYVASICCNYAGCHWLEPAKWLYYHLLDGDLASNHLSWQWVSGAFSSKKYFASQGNIERFFPEGQNQSFMDNPEMEIPVLENISSFQPTDLVFPQSDYVPENKQTLVYNYYNLDPRWHKAEEFQRILLLEPSLFHKYPIKQKMLDFTLEISQNIPDLKIFVGGFSALQSHVDSHNLRYKEHPLNTHYFGVEEARDWLGTTTGYFPSFFKFWNKLHKTMNG